MTLVGVGHALADTFAFVDEEVPTMLGLHPGSFNQVPDYRMRAILATLPNAALSAGGSAANTVKLAARLGVDAHFVGQCGHDAAGQVFEAELLGAGVKVALTRSDSPTGRCVTFLGSGRTVATFRSASGNLVPGLVGPTLLSAADAVVVEGYLLDEPEFFAHLLSQCAAAHKAVSLDIPPGELAERHRDELLKHLESRIIRNLFVPEAEAATLTGLDAEGALRSLSASGRTVVLKRDSGWLVRSAGTTTAIEGGPPAAESTGADDAFQAAFLWAAGQGWPAAQACQAGRLAALCVSEVPGTRIEGTRWQKLKDELASLSASPR